jgi:hypothetical protein
MRAAPVADSAHMIRYILARRLLRRGPTPDEAFDRFAGPLGATPPAHTGRGGGREPDERELRPRVSLDAAMREQARAGERELVRSVRPTRRPAPAARPEPGWPDAAPADSERRTAPPR